MQTYGLIVADNGSDMYITGTYDTRWDNNILNPAFSLLSASDFDVIQLGWQPASGAAVLASVGANPGQVVGGNGSTGTVTLTSGAPASGASVALSSPSSAVSVPGSVTVGQGATSANFAITTKAVGAQTLTSISATYAGVTQTTTFTVSPPAPAALVSLGVNPASVAGGTSATGTVTLSAPAPPGGARVTLKSSKSTVASVPANVAVAAGTTSKTFTVTTSRASRNSAVTLSASYLGVTKTTSLTVAAGGRGR
jgi:hypothetical protein